MAQYFMGMMESDKPRMTASEARDISTHNSTIERDTHDRIRRQADNAIRSAGRTRQSYLVPFTIPALIFGRPTYHHRAMIKRFTMEMEKDGFKVHTRDPMRPENVLIDWRPDETNAPPTGAAGWVRNRRRQRDKRGGSSDEILSDLKNLNRRSRTNRRLGHDPVDFFNI